MYVQSEVRLEAQVGRDTVGRRLLLPGRGSSSNPNPCGSADQTLSWALHLAIHLHSQRLIIVYNMTANVNLCAILAGLSPTSCTQTWS
jgi:hypothetical protein